MLYISKIIGGSLATPATTTPTTTTNTDSENKENQVKPQNGGTSPATSTASNDPSSEKLAKKEAPNNLPQLQVTSPTPKKIPSLNSPPKSRLAPVAKPMGIDPVEILKEREHR